MKYLSTLVSLLLVAVSLVAATPQPVRVVSFNIRYATSSRQDGEKPWWDLFCFITSSRCRQRRFVDHVKQIVNSAPAGAVTVMGLQEVLDNQLKDIKDGLGSPWTHVGVARDDGKKDGEYSPILYRTDALKLIYSEVKWLSPTPDVVSFGWGAGSRRIVTIAVFESLKTGKRFIHANTHLDNVSSQARIEGIKVVLARVKAVQSQYGPLGVTITGDFNSQQGGDAYNALANSGYAQDMYNKAAGNQRFGSYETYSGFSSSTQASRMDFIWLGPTADNRFSVQRYEVWNNVIDGTYVSDHRAVVGDVTAL